MSTKRPEFKLDAFLPFRLLNVSEDVSLQFARIYRRKYNLTRPEWRTFAILGEQAATTATDIGQISHMHKTKVSRAIASLANRGWLTRTRDQKDKRIEHLKLTVRGSHNYRKLADEARLFTNAIELQMGAEAMKTIWQAIRHLDQLSEIDHRDKHVI